MDVGAGAIIEVSPSLPSAPSGPPVEHDHGGAGRDSRAARCARHGGLVHERPFSPLVIAVAGGVTVAATIAAVSLEAYAAQLARPLRRGARPVSAARDPRRRSAIVRDGPDLGLCVGRCLRLRRRRPRAMAAWYTLGSSREPRARCPRPCRIAEARGWSRDAILTGRCEEDFSIPYFRRYARTWWRSIPLCRAISLTLPLAALGRPVK